MTLAVDVPGVGRLQLEHLVLDVNGTLTDRGALIEGVRQRLVSLGASLSVLLVSADTFGTLAALASQLHVEAVHVESGGEKLRLVRRLGPEQAILIGNGANDAPALAVARLGIVVIGPEGASGLAVRAADIICASILDALDLLLDERALIATLRT